MGSEERVGWEAKDSWGGEGKWETESKDCRACTYHPPGVSAIRKDTFLQGTGLGTHNTVGRVAGPIISLPAHSPRTQKAKQPKKWRRMVQETGEKPS